MINDAFLALMHKLDRILDGQDVVFAVFVALVDNRCQGRRLPRTGGPGDQHQALGEVGETADHRRQSELLDRHDFTGNLPEHRANTVFLLKIVAAVARQTGNFVTEIDIPGFLEEFNLFLRTDLVEHGAQLIISHFLELHPLHVTADPQERLLSRHHVQIGGSFVVHQFKKTVYLRHCFSPLIC